MLCEHVRVIYIIQLEKLYQFVYKHHTSRSIIDLLQIFIKGSVFQILSSLIFS